jgi:hypothetical protein
VSFVFITGNSAIEKPALMTAVFKADEERQDMKKFLK